MISSSVCCTIVHILLFTSVMVHSAEHNANNNSERYATVRHLIANNKEQPVYTDSSSVNNRQLLHWQPEMSVTRSTVSQMTHRADKQPHQKKLKRVNRQRQSMSRLDDQLAANIPGNKRKRNDNSLKRKDKKREILRLRKSKENFIPLNYVSQDKLARKIKKKKLSKKKQIQQQLAVSMLSNRNDTIMEQQQQQRRPSQSRLEVSLNAVDTRMMTKKYNNKSIADCHCSHICSQDGGRCDCFKGFRLRADGRTCKDVNECKENKHRCSHECQNLPGSYRCLCPDGYRPDDAVCRDVNECLLNNGHGPCQDTCRNTVGAYVCTCERLPGSQLAADGRTCVSLNQCQHNSAGCSHECVSARGRSYCLCPSGMQLGYDWKTCEAIVYK